MSASESDRRTDVFVIGGGPAGATAAADLANAGFRVALAHRPRLATPTGEILRADTRVRLEAAGVWSQLRSTALRPINEVVSTWDGDGPFCASAIADPHGPGFLIDRQAFDRILLDRCRRNGVAVIDSRVHEVERTSAGWRLQAENGSRVCSAMVVDATGRSAWLTRRHGARHRIDDLTAVSRTVCSADRSPRLMVESGPNGWRYSVPTFDGRQRVTVEVSDRDLLGDVTGHRRSAATALSEWEDDQLVPVGDALLSLDPLSGAGITFGIVSGGEAAVSIRSALAGDETAISRYRRGARLLWDRELDRRRETYGREKRWADRVFWSRRNSLDR